MRTCSTCKIEKELSEFHKKNGGHSYMCKECRKVYIRNHYNNNKEKYLEASRTKRETCQEWLREYKKTLRCEFCGENHPACLDFHHRDRESKRGSVSLIALISLEALKLEIAKCSILCSNCHRKLHYNERIHSSTG